MSIKSDLLELIPEQGILPLYYHEDPDVSIHLMKALYSAGIRTTEYADRGEAALGNFKAMRKVCDSQLPGMRLGIGTIKNAGSARRYIDAGAEFLVCPGIFESVIEIADLNNLLCIPGAMTPTDIIRAEASGVQIVKLFPANNLGPDFVEAVQGIFPALKFLPTGGIELDKENLSGWFKSGICAVGGSKLITPDIKKTKNYNQLTDAASRTLELIRLLKSTN
jgi:2-dehydro-3-deoxyphosphogluconate aldolase / (4S)-4-hydroxy-2-oxoglutarate aldolase